ncbi:MAG: hypothetical protein BWX70_03524 [Verrucomicrobia bacterium ADurb.Bin070]|nr:MAG: hypothetical protein BWX70_03524 [Verrucomicrobia bacterium ADurb.Bin070]
MPFAHQEELVENDPKQLASVTVCNRAVTVRVSSHSTVPFWKPSFEQSKAKPPEKRLCLPKLVE